jgi:two-component system, OmpR family, sensor histidine kinase KdpD
MRSDIENNTKPPANTPKKTQWSLYGRAFFVVVGCTVIATILFAHVTAANLSMVYLAGIVFTALYYGRGPSILATVLSVGVFDFLFTQPFLTFAISDVQYILTLFVMLLVAITVSGLAVRSKQQTEAAKESERQTASLYAMNRKFSDTQGLQKSLDMAAQQVAIEFESRVMILMPDTNAKLEIMSVQPPEFSVSKTDLELAQWAFKHGQTVDGNWGATVDPSSLYLPLNALEKTVGVLGIYRTPNAESATHQRRQLLEAFANQIGLAIERIQLTKQAQQAQMQAETERLRSNLLSSVSHDLRTPLAAITGATSTLLEQGLSLDAKTHHELSQVAYEEAQRMNRLVGNLLDMTRLESGGLKVEKEWQTLEEAVGVALRQIGKQPNNHPITVHLSPDMPFVPMDSILIEQVLVNLLENAIKYTPSESPIELSATSSDSAITVQVADRGPGIPAGNEEKIFDKFFRANPSATGGVGLGLTICKGIVEAHSGSICAQNRPDGGAIFSFTLPLEGQQPELKEEE